jgi:hypothetical protein
MHKCPECGYKMSEEKSFGHERGDDSFGIEGDEEASIKDSVLAELMDVMEESLGSKLKEKKPAAMSVEAISIKPKKKMFSEDEDEEEFA